MDKTKLLQKISEELSSKSIYDDFERNISNLRCDNLRLGIMGQANTAKTTLINGLAGISLPTSPLYSSTRYSVSYGVKPSEDCSVTEEGKVTNIIVDSKWLHENNLTLVELTNDVVPDETTAIDLCNLISQFDACVYLLNAQSALSRTDMFILKNLNDIQLPVILVLSRIDLLSDEDRTEVMNYVKSNIKECSNIKLVEISSSVKGSVSTIKEAINHLLKKVDVRAIRDNFINFYLTMAIGRLYEICQKHIDESNEKKSSINQLYLEKLDRLEEKSTDWLKIETSFRRRISAISDRLRDFLSGKKEDMARRLSHDVDVCGDVKLFWEKDFPFRLEELMRSEMGSATQIVNQELIKVMKWLQDELMKQFKCKISLTTGIVSDKGSASSQNPDEIDIADSQKLKIVTRIGTAATIIAAGTLLASTGVGGIVMAVSMMSGLGAELLMKKQNDNSKEQIKKHIPTIVERANLQLLSDFEVKIQNVTNDLIAHIQTLKADWMESSKKTFEQEKSIATFNSGSDKWEAIMARINQLSELLIN